MANKDFDKFIYKKIQIEDSVSTYYYWYLIGKENREGVHFHGSVSKKPSDFLDINEHGFYPYGIEKHCKTAVYEGQAPISYCDVTGGECFPDGSSLQAKERLGFVNPDGSHDDYIWSTLRRYYGYWIENENN